MRAYNPRMRYWYVKAVALSLFALLVFAGGALASQPKVTICHAAGQAGTTHYVELTIGYPAVYGPAGHFYENGTTRAGHEDDYLGPCRVAPTPTPTTRPTPTIPPQPTPTPEVTPAPSNPIICLPAGVSPGDPFGPGPNDVYPDVQPCPTPTPTDVDTGGGPEVTPPPTDTDTTTTTITSPNWLTIAIAAAAALVLLLAPTKRKSR